MSRISSIISLIALSLLWLCPLHAQELNLSFDNLAFNPWYKIGTHEDYHIRTDLVTKMHGPQSLFIENNKPTTSFGGLMMQLPYNLQGDSIEITAYMKLSDVTTNLGFMLRIDPELYFNNFQEHHIKGSKDWKAYTIKAKLNPARTSGIYIGIFLSGQGKLWADNIQISVDGKPLSKDIYIPYRKDYSSITESGVKDFEANASQIAQLTAACKIWGLLKYRHPSLASGTYDWDQELFKAINNIAVGKSTQAFEQYYSRLMDSLGNFQAEKPKSSERHAVQAADYKWIEELPLNQQLKHKLALLPHTKIENHYYYSFPSRRSNVKIEHEYSYNKVKNPDVGFRLLALFRFWNIVQYFSPYRSLTDSSWDTVLETYIPKMLNAKDQHSYIDAISSLLSEMKDAHTGLWGAHNTLSITAQSRFMPAAISYANGKPIVNRLVATADNKLQVGDIIIQKNGKPIKEIQDSVYHLISTPNAAVIEREMAKVLIRSVEEADNLLIDRNGKKLKLQVPTIPTAAYKVATDSVAIRFLEGNIAYLNHGILTSKAINLQLDSLMNSAGLIIDIRNYPKEALLYFLAPFFIDKESPFVKFTYTDMDNFGVFQFSDSIVIKPHATRRYAGKIAILINEQTQSASEFHSMGYRSAAKAKVFGSQTAGADGNISVFSLPGDINTAISGLGVYYPDGRATQRIGIVPDKEIKPSIKGVRAGKDEVLEAALKYVKP